MAGNPSFGLRQHRIYPNGCLRGHRIWHQHKWARLWCGSCSLGCCHCVAICTDSRQVRPPKNDCCVGLVGANSYVAGRAVAVVFCFGCHANHWQAAWHCPQRVRHCFRHGGNGQQHTCVGTQRAGGCQWHRRWLGCCRVAACGHLSVILALRLSGWARLAFCCSGAHQKIARDSTLSCIKQRAAQGGFRASIGCRSCPHPSGSIVVANRGCNLDECFCCSGFHFSNSISERCSWVFGHACCRVQHPHGHPCVIWISYWRTPCRQERPQTACRNFYSGWFHLDRVLVCAIWANHVGKCAFWRHFPGPRLPRNGGFPKRIVSHRASQLGIRNHHHRFAHWR